MNILILSDAEAPHTQRWANWLSRHGISFDLVTFNPKVLKGYLVEPIVINSRFFSSIRPFKMIEIFFRLLLLIKRRSYDVAHSHSCGGYAWVLSLFNVPFIITPWGTDLLIDVKSSRFNRLLTRFALSRCNLITTDGRHFVEIIQSDLKISTPVQYHIFGTDVVKHRKYRAQLSERRELGDHQRIVFISTRTLFPMHRVDLTVSAFIRLAKEVDNAFLTIVGGGSDEMSLKEMVADAGMLERVEFTGMLSEDELFGELARSDIYISTSPHDAGLAASTAEAMSVGLPVLHPDIGDNTYWVSEGRGGFSFSSGNVESVVSAMRKICSSRSQWAEMSKLNYEKINLEYNQDLQMENFVQFYSQISRG